MSDRIAIMRAGRIEQVGAAEEIYARPISRFIAEFMGEVNLFDIKRASDGTLHAPDLRIADGLKGDGIAPTPGEHGALMVRPEFVRFLSGENAGGMDFSVRGILRDEFAFGSRLQYEVEIENGARVTVEKLREDRFNGESGSSVTLGWNSVHSHFIKET